MAGPNLSTTRTTSSTAAEHVADHNTVHRMVNRFDDSTPTVNGHVPTWNGTTFAPSAPPGASSGTNLGTNYENVMDHGAVGNGTTDDRAAINAAITAAGIGGTVFFPRVGSGFGLSASIAPLERQRWVGMHSPFYDWDDTAGSNSALRALATFTGGGLVHMTNTTVGRGTTFSNLAFIGRGDTVGTLNGIDCGPASGGERAWLIKECQFAMLGGAGIGGHMWVIDVRDSHITRCGYGIRPASGAAGAACVAFDNRWMGNQIYFTFHHAIALNGTAESGAVTMDNNRVERAGTQVAGNTVDPNVNRDETACGILLTRASGIQISNTYTDANASQGLRIDGAVNKGSVRMVRCTGNIWRRDGTGNNSTSTLPGVYIRNCTNVSHDGDIVSWGDPDDGTNDPLITRVAPQQGVAHGDTDWWVWRGTVELSATNTFANAYPAITGAAASFRPTIDDARYTLVRGT